MQGPPPPGEGRGLKVWENRRRYGESGAWFVVRALGPRSISSTHRSLDTALMALEEALQGAKNGLGRT